MEFTQDWAQQKDQQDSLHRFKDEFYFPQHEGKPVIYLTGNSLGLQPKQTQAYIQEELDAWKELGVDGHFEGKRPWMEYHKFFAEKIAKIVGADKKEVVVMNNLTVNLHILFASFYRPTATRHKIIMEGGAFPSDMYAVESQVKHHGFNPSESIIEVTPRAGENALRDEDIIAAIEEHGAETALVFFSGVQYFTGQVFDMESITKAAHKAGAFAGFDLAHAAGNIKLNLHDWNADFAAWCSYKYLNSGPGGVSGIFVHEKHGNNPKTPRFAGWWGYQESTRFQMKKGFIPEPGAAGWQLSNAPVFSMIPHLASLDLFDDAGMDNLVAKQKEITAYLEFVLAESAPQLKVITPESRGSQLSILTDKNGKHLFDYLTKNGVITDWREPHLSDMEFGVIRMAPVPMYTSFEDIYNLGMILSKYQAPA
jgi:kynureninase